MKSSTSLFVLLSSLLCALLVFIEPSTAFAGQKKKAAVKKMKVIRLTESQMTKQKQQKKFPKQVQQARYQKAYMVSGPRSVAAAPVQIQSQNIQYQKAAAPTHEAFPKPVMSSQHRSVARD